MVKAHVVEWGAVAFLFAAPVWLIMQGAGLLLSLTIGIAGSIAIPLAFYSRAPTSVSRSSDPKQNQAALITGASAGIGRALADQFAAGGFDVILVARRADKLKSAADSISRKFGVTAKVIESDLTKPNAGSALYNQVAATGMRVTALVNCAGFGANGRFDSVPLEKNLEMVQLNITALTELTRLYVKDMVEAGSGRILQVASTAGYQPGPLSSVYFASKAFVVSFSEALWYELRGTGVTCTALCPGPVRTEFSEAAGSHETVLFKYMPVMTAEDVAKAGFLACIRGERNVIPGPLNWLLAHSNAFVPKFLALALSEVTSSRI